MSWNGEDLKQGENGEEAEKLGAANAEHMEEIIRRKTEEVEIPDSLKPEQIEQMLLEHAEKRKMEEASVQKEEQSNLEQEHAQKKETVEPEQGSAFRPKETERLKKKRPRWRTFYTVAAACCVAAVGIAAYGGVFKGQSENDMTASAEMDSGEANEKSAKGISDGTAVGGNRNKVETIASAKNENEIYRYIKAERKRREKERNSVSIYRTMEDSGEMVESASDSSAAGMDVKQFDVDYSDTNTREEDVGEGDIVKTDGKNLYILNGQKVQIVGIENQEMEEKATIRLADDQYISQIFVKDSRLILVYTQTEYEDGKNGYGGTYKEYTVAETYDVSNPKKPEAIGKITQSGSFYTMRVNGDYVYLFSTFYADTYAGREETASYIPQVQGKEVAYADILLPQYAQGNQYTVVFSFSLDNPEEKVGSKAIFGCSGLIYVSGNHIYACESYYNSDNSSVAQTCIRKLSYTDGKLEAVGQMKVDGTLNDSFSIDEYKGNLRMVTTVTSSGNSGGFPNVLFDEAATEEAETKQSNSLYILDEKLEELGKIEGLAEGENVYSARFMGDTGYFVTYKQIDPLFSVDLSNPKKPKILGELKIPGFSNYLHPYGEGKLLGIGMDVDETGTTTNGVKLSMFDISDPSDVEEVRKVVLESCYGTEAANNYKSVLVSVNRNMIGFTAYGDAETYYLYTYSEDEGFTCLFERELSRYGSTRGIYVGDMFYIVSGNTVEAYRLDTFDKVDDIVL